MRVCERCKVKKTTWEIYRMWFTPKGQPLIIDDPISGENDLEDHLTCDSCFEILCEKYNTAYPYFEIAERTDVYLKRVQRLREEMVAMN
jgi:hypothetical protein